jgi:hypothetical protein
MRSSCILLSYTPALLALEEKSKLGQGEIGMHLLNVKDSVIHVAAPALVATQPAKREAMCVVSATTTAGHSAVSAIGRSRPLRVRVSAVADSSARPVAAQRMAHGITLVVYT